MFSRLSFFGFSVIGLDWHFGDLSTFSEVMQRSSVGPDVIIGEYDGSSKGEPSPCPFKGHVGGTSYIVDSTACSLGCNVISGGTSYIGDSTTRSLGCNVFSRGTSYIGDSMTRSLGCNVISDESSGSSKIDPTSCSAEGLIGVSGLCVTSEACFVSFLTTKLGRFGDDSISPKKRRFPKMATASLTERKGREASTSASIMLVGEGVCYEFGAKG